MERKEVQELSYVELHEMLLLSLPKGTFTLSQVGQQHEGHFWRVMMSWI
jgi:hypothetical protein